MAKRDEVTARLDTLWAEYERLRDAATLARTQMLSNRLTHTRKEAQLHEAEVEEADDQADYFAERVAETATATQASRQHLAALEAQAEGARSDLLIAQSEAVLGEFAAALRDLALHAAAMLTALESTAVHIQQASAWAEQLPATAVAPRDAATEARELYIALEALLHDLIEAAGRGQQAASE